MRMTNYRDVVAAASLLALGLPILSPPIPAYGQTGQPPAAPEVTVGAGDSLLAGYVSSRYGGRAPDECMRFAVACGAESVQHFGAGVIDPKEVGRLLDEVSVEELTEHAVSSG